ncbi:single-stranded DNA-binding protein [Limosilactobacillus fermentum]|uniref:single-stranded DNA-binding protein n=1 Tax=Limosilactobacillus fermentum TaxID=1613 RepID=UPI002F26374A
MINRVVLTGRLTRDIEVKYTNSGTSLARFSLAVDRRFKNKQTGERETDFISCEIWRQAAENLAKLAGKGSMIGIDGRIQTSHYTGRDGKEVYRTDVVVDSFSLFSYRNEANQNYQAGDCQANNNLNASQSQTNSVPYGGMYANGTPTNDFVNSQTIDKMETNQPVNTKDLPFAGEQPVEQAQQGSSMEDLPF